MATDNVLPAIEIAAENPGKNRAFHFGKSARDAYDPKIHKPYAVNRITTSKYTILSFLPKSIYGQFRRLANFYFLFMSLTMMVGEYTTLFDSPISWTTTFLSLIVIMTFTMVMQIKDDVQRHIQDAEVDAREAESLREDKTIWKDVKVGDIIVVKNQEFFPADVVLLTSSSKAGSCYIETSNIDGETNLKIRSSVPKISDWLQAGKLGDLDAAKKRCEALQGTIEYQLPNSSVNSFGGIFTKLEGGAGAPPFKRSDCTLNDKQQLLRGSCLRNTKWILGLVVYTGEESKVAMNSQETPEKLSNLENVVNKSMKVILAVMLLLVLITDIGATIFRSNTLNGDYSDTNRESNKFWYLFPNGKNEDDWYDLPHFMAMLFTYAILYNNMVPLSMYVTMELINMYHAQYINNDKNMFDPETQTAARARTMNLCSELGQIQYIFSDKTGTLTANIMEFKRCSIGGKMFGSLDTKHFESKELFACLKAGPDGADGACCQDIVNFMTVMAVGHTVVAEPDKTNAHGVHYEAESPDEGALVEGAAACGFRFVKRSPDTITVRYEGVTPLCTANGGKKIERTFKLLAINTFNSTRKRSSMLVETPDGKILLLCKGADNIMLARAAKGSDKRKINEHLTAFSKQGLRTLVMGTREISVAERDAWLKKFREASGSTVDRKKKLMAVAEEIEKDMRIVGASAIEDKLQDGVPDCIADVRQAGVKLWVLTGDKMETAINIGYSCRLLDAEKGKMKILKMKVDEDMSTLHNIEEVEETLRNLCDQIDIVRGRKKSSGDSPASADVEACQLTKKDLKNLALVITGPTLGFVYDPIYPWKYKPPNEKKKKKTDDDDNDDDADASTKTSSGNNYGIVDKTSLSDEQIAELEKKAEDRCARMKKYLLELGKVCKVVVACRVSPLQKALTVRLVKEGLEVTPVTLAIGDGANDVSMIKEAHVGVGISGREGLQAANSADFSIAQFRFLKPLLFTHGRYDYRRMSKVILYSFYKNVVLVLTIFYYNFFNGFSGQPMYDDWLYSGFNLFLFASPIMLGIFDMDVDPDTVSEVPQLYMSGRLQLDLNTHKMVENILLSILNSIVIMVFSALSYPTLDDGVNNGVYLFGTLVFSNLFFSMQYRCLFIGHTWNKYTLYGIGISLFLFFLFFLLYGGAVCLYMGDPATFFYYVPMHLMGQPIYWITVMSTICICASFDLIAEYLRVEFSPNLIDLCVEIEMSERKAERKKSGIRALVGKRMNQILQAPSSFISSFTSTKRSNGSSDPDKSDVSPPAFPETAAPRMSPRLKTQKSILTLHEAEKGHDSDDEHDSAFPDEAHTGPLFLAHMATHNEDSKNVDVSMEASKSDHEEASKVRDEDSVRPATAIDIETKEAHNARESLVEKPSSSMIPCFKSKDGPAPLFIDTPFYQQKLPKQQLFVTARGSAISHFVIGAMLMIFGGVIYDASESVIYLDTSYAGRIRGAEGDFSRGKAFYAHADCGNNTLKDSFNPSLYGNAGWYEVENGVECTVTFRVPHEMKGPVTVFYRLTEFYQNYNAYFASRDSLQLTGYADDSSTCNVENSGYNRIGKTEDGCTIGTDGCEYMYPCGLVSNTLFNDTFELVTRSASDNCTCDTANADQIPRKFDCSQCQVWPTTSVTMQTDDIAWDSDGTFYKAYDNYGLDADTSYLNDTYPSADVLRTSAAYEYGLEDPRYQVWMRPAALPDFKKTYAEIDEDIPANAEVQFRVTSRFPAFFYGGTKHIVVATQNWQGASKSYIMPWIFMGFGIYAISVSFLIVLKMFICPRPPGTDTFVDQVANDEDYVPSKEDWAVKSVITGMFSKRKYTEDYNNAGAATKLP